MAESTRLVDLVQQSIDSFLSARATEFTAIAPELVQFTDAAAAFLAGGKRFRALFCYWGWQSVRGVGDGFDPLPDDRVSADLPGIVESAALLLGDLLLGWSDELFDRGTALLAARDAALAGRAEFARMRTEVMAGQYLDILEEHAWVVQPESEALPRAQRVIVYKSAKYSIEAPLAIGGALGGASLAQLAALRAFGLPLGVAYQLRDDLLGVFGDPSVTGKPAGDDLREGKRTVLIALARPALPSAARNLLDELLGDPELDDQQIEMIRTALRDCGAVAQVEKAIEANVRQARDALAEAPLAPSARSQLAELADTVTRRVA